MASGAGAGDLHFGCSLCGDCCQHFQPFSGPVAGIDDIATLHERAILVGHGVLYMAPEAYARAFIADHGIADEDGALFEQIRDARESLACRVGTTGSWFSAQLTQMPDLDGRCRFLEGNACAIYERRPYVCRMWPFSADSGISQARRLLDDLSHCDTSPSAGLLMTGETVVDPDYLRHWAELPAVNARRRETARLVLANPAVTRAVRQDLARPDGLRQFHFNLIPFLAAALSMNGLDRDGALAVLDGQRRLIADYVASAVAGRMKHLKTVTATLKAFAAQYADYERVLKA